MDTTTRIEALMSDQESTASSRKALQMIATDMADDAVAFDGKPFTGRTVAEYMANQGAAIAALAKIVADLLPVIESAKTGLAAIERATSTEPLDAEQQTRIAGYLAMAGNSQIERTEIGDVTVDTSWVSYANPRIETMILGGEFDHFTVATPYVDEADARTGHAAVVEALRDGRTPDGLVA